MEIGFLSLADWINLSLLLVVTAKHLLETYTGTIAMKPPHLSTYKQMGVDLYPM